FLQLEYPHFNGRGPYPAIILSKKEPVRPAHLIVLRSDGNRHTVGERYCLNGWLRRYGRLRNRRHALGIYLPGFAIFGDFVKNDLPSSLLQPTDFRESPGGLFKKGISPGFYPFHVYSRTAYEIIAARLADQL